ncbi:urease accessory protein UreF [Gordonia sp. (in: high G+C Gram-positive bacteria)]|uniref:urease accessory protein UreF n=1 Tax=Gordonia sp. (in: high G+C Gram-positive bacteria) TaxID=84139 RepID=UPI0039E60D7F
MTITEAADPGAMVRAMRAMQFSDTMLPVGSFSFSNGLETGVAEGLIVDEPSLREFVAASVHQAAGCDGIAVLHAHRAATAQDPTGVAEADAAVWERKLNEEARTMVTRMGRKAAELGLRLVPGSAPIGDWLAQIKAGATPGTYPATQGLILAEVGGTEEEAFGVHQYGIAATVLGAALRLVRVDHLDAQKILYDVNASIGEDYERIRGLGLDDMSTFAPMLDIFASIHVGSHVRMFMN